MPEPYERQYARKRYKRAIRNIGAEYKDSVKGELDYYDRKSGFRPGAARTVAAEVDQGLRAYMLGVYNYMTLGLAVTGLTALGTHMLAAAQEGGHAITLTPLGQALYASPLRWVTILAPLAFVFLISARMDKMSAASSRNLFLAFSAMMGLSMSSMLIVFTGVSVARVFFPCDAPRFVSLRLLPRDGRLGRRDRRSRQSLLAFERPTGLQFALSILSVLIFSGLTAWDSQSIKDMYFESDGYELAHKKSVFGALRLYLDFINMFQSLLYLFGGKATTSLATGPMHVPQLPYGLHR